MINRPNTTQQINTYIRSQQLLYRHLQLCQRIKKADHPRKEVSASNNQVTNPNVRIRDLQKLDVTSKINNSNQITLGANQHATV